MTDFLNSVTLLTNYIVVPGLTYGSQLALGALGITMIYAVLRFSNFAHGELMSFGAMSTILVTWLLQSYGIKLGFLPTALLAIPFAALITVLYCLLTNSLIYEYYREKKNRPHNLPNHFRRYALFYCRSYTVHYWSRRSKI